MHELTITFVAAIFDWQ